MTEQDEQQLEIFTSRKRLWWLRFFRWPGLLKRTTEALKAEVARSNSYQESFRAEQGRSALLEKLGQDSRADTRDIVEKLQAEQAECLKLLAEQNALRNDMAQALESIRDLKSRLDSEKLESERLRADVSKTQAQLERAELHVQTQKLKMDEQAKLMTATYRWIRETHRLDVPINTPIRKLFSTVKKTAAIALVLIPLAVNGQFPPPFFRNAWTTNRPPNPVYGQNNLSVTNLGSGTNWQFYNVGPNTIARLTDITNAAGPRLTTNANQFLGVPLSIKAGAFQTNGNFFSDSTNHSQLYVEGLLFTTHVVPAVPDSYALGTVASPYLTLDVGSGGVSFFETGGALLDSVQLIAPANVTATYSIVLPDSQGADGSVITNDSTGKTGWWNASSVISQKQQGSALLTNLSNNPYTGYTNQLAAGTNIFLTTASGTTTLNVPTDFTNIYYVNKDSNLSQILTNAPNNSTIWIGTGDWTNRASICSFNRDLGSLHLKNKTNMLIQAVGRATIWVTNQSDHFTISNCYNVQIRGLTFNGIMFTNLAATNQFSAIILMASKQIEVDHNTFVGLGDCGIFEGADYVNPTKYVNTNILVHDNRFFTGGSWWASGFGSATYDGPMIQCGSYWRIFRNTFIECAIPLEFFARDANQAVHCIVEDNYIENPIKWGMSDAGETNNYYHRICRNFIVFNDSIRTASSNALTSAQGIYVTTAKGYVIEDNTIIGPPSIGIIFVDTIAASGDSWNCYIERNVISNTAEGITIGQSSGSANHRGFKIAGNRIHRTSNWGIAASGTDMWVEDNDLEDCGTAFWGGILVGRISTWVATNVVVINNRIRSSPGTVIPNPGISFDNGAFQCRQFNNDITGTYTPQIVDNGSGTLPPLLIAGVTGNSTNRLMVLGTNGAPVWYIDNRGFSVLTNSMTNRVAAPTNMIAQGAESFAGMNLPNWTDHNGLQAALQPLIANENIYWINTLAGTLIGSDGVLVTTNGGTVISHPAPVESQPFMVDLATPASSNGCASAFSSTALANAGAHNGASKIGGYWYAATWNCTNLIHQVIGGGAPRTFVGLTARAAEDYTNMVVTTNATGQYAGLYVDAHQSTNIYMSARDASAEFRTNTGIAFVATNVYKFYMYNAPTSRFLGWRLDDAYSGGSAQGWFSNNVPTNFMSFGIATKNGTNRAHGVRFSRLYLQAPLSPPR